MNRSNQLQCQKIDHVLPIDMGDLNMGPAAPRHVNIAAASCEFLGHLGQLSGRHPLLLIPRRSC